MKITLDVTGLGNHPDISSVYDYLIGQGFNVRYCKSLSDFYASDDYAETTMACFHKRAVATVLSVSSSVCNRTTCYAAIGELDFCSYETATLVVLADCMYNDFRALKSVIDHYVAKIEASGHTCELSADTKELLTYIKLEEKSQEDSAKPDECPFCDRREEVDFGSEHCHLQLDTDGTVNCYQDGQYAGSFKFPKCPMCGKDFK